MKVFHCDHCDQPVFFENTFCLSCNRPLAYLPDAGVVGSLDAAGDGVWKSPLGRASAAGYRLCKNYTAYDTCNWAVPADDPDRLCECCRLTQVIPDLDKPNHKLWWYKLEVAKRRLVYTLRALKLPVVSKDDAPDGGLAFEFMADPEDPALPRVLTGHADGLITVNVAEADDAEREKRRQLMREPYRTLLGHMRHESGHYYWDRLIRDDETRLAAFRELFGDESASYADALKRHYDNGPPADWPTRHVSAYASMHPWEDWAETWAHYLHLIDTLETAAACGVSLRPGRRNRPTMKAVPDPVDDIPEPFDDLLESWYAVTYMLNNLNRGLGQGDAYPFVLPGPAVNKLRFVHDAVHAAAPACERRAGSEDSGGVIRRAMGWLLRGFPAAESAGAKG